MKIAIVFLQFNVAGGSQRQALSLGRMLQNLGHTVVFYTGELIPHHFPDLLDGLDIRVIRPPRVENSGRGVFAVMWNKYMRDRSILKNCRDIAEAMDPDFAVVNGHDYDTYKVGYFYKRRNSRAKFVWMMNEIPFSYMPKKNFVLELTRTYYNAFKKISERKYFQSIDQVATLNDFDAAWARRMFNLRVSVVASGCDFERFFMPVHSLSAGSTVRLLTVGIFGAHRRFEDTIIAAALLRGQGIDARVRILGSFGNKNSEYARLLFELIAKYKLESFVEMTFGSVSEDELRSLYHETDFFVFPTFIGSPRNGYGWGLAAFEAMAAGLPVVLPTTTASVRLLRDGENAMIVAPKNPAEIADKIKLLVKNPEKYERVAKNGQELVRTKVSWHVYAKTMEHLFQL